MKLPFKVHRFFQSLPSLYLKYKLHICPNSLLGYHSSGQHSLLGVFTLKTPKEEKGFSENIFQVAFLKKMEALNSLLEPVLHKSHVE